MINDYIRGLRASFSGPALVAVAWSWAATLVMAALLTTLVFTFVSGTVGSSAMAEQLRQGMTGSWIIDLTGTLSRADLQQAPEPANSAGAR